MSIVKSLNDITMRRIFLSPLLVSIAFLFTACDLFKALHTAEGKTSQGAPYELLTVCEQREWMGQIGDSLRAVFTAPVPYLNQKEPHFDVLRVRANDFKGMLAAHRNILNILVDTTLNIAKAGVQYDVTAAPQAMVTLQAPSEEAMLAYISEHGDKLMAVFEDAERERALDFAKNYGCPAVERAVKKTFDVDICVPKSYILAQEKEDFLWARNEYPKASQGFMVYSYPYKGSQNLTLESLVAARNKFAMNIPGPVDGSYMTTSDAFEPGVRMMTINGRRWCELRGFWDVEGDYMGGPFVSYTTVDKRSGRVFTFDAYVYSPKFHKRNYVRGLEHIVYSISFPEKSSEEKSSKQ